ncbi:hypothetical protein CDL12_24172 [Handroanthus impetiginosus]|uniref:BRCT domain-containing protein n=1 Tax=Handroanthus impetiginosus TaxID=429701 RepID=A0A2G9GDC6_9LAMI|nr:hypothetical protein CDL12_24172 [Handroanthus impetiginosus]
MSESSTRKRNLPSWMSSREEENDDSEKSRQPRNNGKSNRDQNVSNLESKDQEKSVSGTGSAASDFSKFMEGVVFVLSGFVNPERGVLRSQMLEMGAEYQPDWNSNCTLLVCAFTNTPKFRQVKADGGTVISKDWISECYNQRKLVDIEPYLLHAGKPWRRHSISHEAREDIKASTSTKSLKQEDKVQRPKKTTGSSKMKGCFSVVKAKKWAVEDLKKTILWLESQDEKPEPSEIKKIAAEGILTCIQDAIDALKQGQGIQQIVEQWACLPRVVEELAQFDGNGTASPSKEDLCKEAMACKQMYELEFLNMEHDDDIENKQTSQSCGSKKVNKKKDVAGDDPSYDSDATIEMTEEEIDQAYNTIACSL